MTEEMSVRELIETAQSFRDEPDQYSELITELGDALERATSEPEWVVSEVYRSGYEVGVAVGKRDMLASLEDFLRNMKRKQDGVK